VGPSGALAIATKLSALGNRFAGIEPMLLGILRTRNKEFKSEQRETPVWFSELGIRTTQWSLKMSKSLVPAKRFEMPEEFERFFDLPAMVGDEKHKITMISSRRSRTL
jgi:hypothetical protein